MTSEATMEERQDLWRAVQLYVRSAGIIIKKLPVTLLKKAQIYHDNPGHLSAQDPQMDAVMAFRKMGLHAATQTQLKGFAGDGLADDDADMLQRYVEDMLSNHPFSKNFNLYVAFKLVRPHGHQGRLEVVGLVGTGTFQPHRSDAGGQWSLRPTRLSREHSVAEMEMIVAKPSEGLGKALALYGLGDLLNRKSHGDFKYTRVLGMAATVKGRRLFQNLRFTQSGAREFHIGDANPRATAERAFIFNPTATKVNQLMTMIQNDRQGLYDLCPYGRRQPSGWPRCR